MNSKKCAACEWETRTVDAAVRAVLRNSGGGDELVLTFESESPLKHTCKESRAEDLIQQTLEAMVQVHERLGRVDLTGYAVKAMPMSTYQELVRLGKERYSEDEGVSSPWDKEDEWDQVDLVWLEEFADWIEAQNDIEDLSARLARRVVKEVRTARGWPEPVKVSLSYEYIKTEDSDG